MTNKSDDDNDDEMRWEMSMRRNLQGLKYLLSQEQPPKLGRSSSESMELLSPTTFRYLSPSTLTLVERNLTVPVESRVPVDPVGN